jgi:ribonuclease G
MSKRIIINVEKRLKRVAVLLDNLLDEIHFERVNSHSIIGSIYRGKVSRVMPGIEAAFVDIGLEKNGFLHVSDITDDSRTLKDVLGEDVYDDGADQKQQRRKNIDDYLKDNDDVLVQVIKDTIGTKGVRLSTNISLPGRYTVLMPRSVRKGISRRIEQPRERKRLGDILAQLEVPESMGVIMRTFAYGKKLKDCSTDLKNQVQMWHKLYKRFSQEKRPVLLHAEHDLTKRIVRDVLSEDINEVIVDTTAEYKDLKRYINTFFPSKKVNLRRYRGKMPIFDHFNIESQVAKVFNRKVWLDCGGSLVIDKTEAMVAIDVNTGKNIGVDDANKTILETNLEAADEVARQLRLRNMGGLVVIDFIDMRSKADRRKVYETLLKALNRDKARNNVLPISDLGLLEMTRQRDSAALGTEFYSNCPGCRGSGVIKQAESICGEIERSLRRYLNQKDIEEITVSAHPRTIDLLMGDEAPEIAKLIKGKTIIIEYEPIESYSLDEWHFQVKKKSR